MRAILVLLLCCCAAEAQIRVVAQPSRSPLVDFAYQTRDGGQSWSAAVFSSRAPLTIPRISPVWPA